MSEEFLEVLLDTGIDALKLLPFLFITYLIMEYIEHKTGDKTKNDEVFIIEVKMTTVSNTFCTYQNTYIHSI